MQLSRYLKDTSENKNKNKNIGSAQAAHFLGNLLVGYSYDSMTEKQWAMDRL